MNKKCKGLASILILVVAISYSVFLMVEPAIAQTTPSPTVPSFTLQVIDEKGTVPTTYLAGDSI